MKDKLTGLYVATIKRYYKDKTYTAYLLRRTYREGGKVKQQTLGNLSHLPPAALALVKGALKGMTFVPLNEGFEVTRTRSYGHVAAVRAMLRHLGLHEILDASPSRERDLVEAMLVARVLEPDSKLATTRWWHTTTLPEDLGVAGASEDELYGALDWLLQRQDRIEAGLAARHLQEGDLVLYDVSSSYYEGSHCPLAAFGHNRDGKKGKSQVVYGLLLDRRGCPVAVKVFAGNTADPRTVAAQVHKLKQQFHLTHVILAGDRGMLTSARIDALKAEGGLDWVTALRAKQIQQLANQGRVQLSLFDEQDLAEITAPDYPGERLIVCRNPLLAEERTRKRNELLAATEQKLEALARRVGTGRLRRKEKIGAALGRVANRYKMAKHFQCEVEEGRFTFRRKEESIRREADLDGIYVIRTNVPAGQWRAEEAVLSYKSLSHAERAFRTLKSVDLQIRPIYHRRSNRVRSHIFLCMLAYYVEWHLRQAWKPFLFDDAQPGRHEGDSPVRPALRSPEALRKAQSQQRPDGTPVHSFRTLLADLATVARNEVRTPVLPDAPLFTVVTTPTPFQTQAFARAGLTLTASDRRQNNPA